MPRSRPTRRAIERLAKSGRPLRFESLEPRQLLTTTRITLQAVADTFTQSGVNAGSQTTLTARDRNGAGGDYMAYIRFNLAGVDLTGLTNAYFTVNRTSGATMIKERFDVFGLANLAGNTPQNWSETTLANAGLGAEYNSTGGNYVDLTRVVNLSAEGVAGANTIEQVSDGNKPQHLSGVDLVSFLNTRQADGGLATFIVLTDAGQDRTMTYASRENADADLRPTLTLEYTPEYGTNAAVYPRQMEYLDRGLIALRRATGEVYLGWRMLGTDPTNVSFNVYRSANGGAPAKLNGLTPIATSTNFVDTTFNAAATNVYTVRPIIDGVEQPAGSSFTLAANAPLRQYLNVPLQIPAGYTVTIPPGSVTPPLASDTNPGTGMPWGGTLGQDQFSVTYTANDASVADLDGDGDYEIIVKWEPTNVANAGTSEFTGKTYFDAYRLDGTRLWRIDMGINMRSSAQYQPFLAYDLDGDGKAELVMRTAPGTVDGAGANVILPGDNPAADYRDPYTGGSDQFGRVLTGPEYLTVFNGATGAATSTVPFLPNRDTIGTWGDTYGHRGENLSMAPAYFDGSRPSIVIGRGIYMPDSTLSGRNELTAWTWRDGQLTMDWWFKSNIGYGDDASSNYLGQGTHGIAVADVDGDGKDEVVFGSLVVDDDGTGLYATNRGHGDTLHVSDMDLSNPGLEIFQPHEDTSLGNHTGVTLRDAATGRLLAAPTVVQYLDPDDGLLKWPDVGRAIAIDIDPNHPGYEFWDSSHGDIFNAQGTAIYAKPSNMHTNFGVWWDADLLRETLDNTTIGDWNYTTHGRSNLVSFANSGINNSSALTANNGTKSTPALSGDILGDWREEVIWRTSDNTALQIWSSAITSTTKLTTLVHDTQYREAVAWQNVGYNQPPNPSYFLGAGMTAQPQPFIYTLPSTGAFPGDFNGDHTVDGDDLPIWRFFFGRSSATGLQPGDADGDRDADGDDLLVWQRNLGTTAPAASEAAIAAAVAAEEEEPLAAIAGRDAAFADLAAAVALQPRWLEIAAPSLRRNPLAADRPRDDIRERSNASPLHSRTASTQETNRMAALNAFSDHALAIVAENKLRAAIDAGEFDNLPGLGKPSPLIDAPYDPYWWVREKLRTENLLPTRSCTMLPSS